VFWEHKDSLKRKFDANHDTSQCPGLRNFIRHCTFSNSFPAFPTFDARRRVFATLYTVYQTDDQSAGRVGFHFQFQRPRNQFLSVCDSDTQGSTFVFFDTFFTSCHPLQPVMQMLSLQLPTAQPPCPFAIQPPPRSRSCGGCTRCRHPESQQLAECPRPLESKSPTDARRW
jgi:hypothetical protein